MNVLVKILLVIGALILVLLAVALFVKSDYHLERAVVIQKPKPEVFEYIKYVKNSENYSKWVMMDPTMRKSFKGTDGTEGFVYSWDSDNKNVGAGEQAIAQIVPNERIDYDLHFIRPFEGKAKAYLITETVSEQQTKVRWGFSSKMPYPMNLMLLFADMEGMLGKDLEIGLANLKNVLEK